MIASGFRKATRQKAKASILIEGLQGSGKSGLALTIAKALAGSWDKIYAIDTENRSLDLFEGIKTNVGEKFGAFNKVDITPDDGYAPSNYAALKEVAIKEGAEVVVMDSISHMWNSKGGLLETVADAQRAGLDNYRSWGTEQNRKEKLILTELVRSDAAHIISTVRIKETFGMEFDETKGKNKVVSLGEQEIQQADLKYEPDLVLRMVRPGNPDGTNPIVEVIKTRYAIFTQGEECEITPELLLQLKAYLEEGVDPEELIVQQKQFVINKIKEYCNTPTKKSIWDELKKSSGHTGKIDDMPLGLLKSLYAKLTDD